MVNQAQLDELSSYLDEIDKLFDSIEGKDINSYSNPSASPSHTRSGLQRHQAPSPTKCFVQGGFYAKGKLNPGEVAVDLVNTIGNQTANIINTAGRAVSTVLHPRWQESYQSQPPSQGVVYPPGGGQQYPPGGGQQYPPGGGQQYPPGGGQQYPPGGGQQYPPGGGQQYPPGHQSGQSVQPPGQWVYVPGGQKPADNSVPSDGYGGYAEANASARGGETNASSNLSRPPPPTKSGLQRCQAPSPTKSYLEGGLDFSARIAPIDAAVDVINAAGNQTANIIDKAGMATVNVLTPVAENVRNVAVNLVNPRGPEIYQYQPPPQVVMYPPGGGQQYSPSNQSDQSVQLPPGKWVYVPAGQKPPPNSYSNLSRPPPSTRSGLQRCHAPSPTKSYIEGGFDFSARVSPSEAAVDLINAAGNQTANIIEHAGRAAGHVVSPVADNVGNVAVNIVNPRGQGISRYQPPSQVVVYPPGSGQQYSPSNQSDQSVQLPPGKWVYVPAGQKPPPNSYSNLSRPPPPTRSGLQRCHAPSPTKNFVQGGFYAKGKLNPGEVAVDLVNTIGNQTANIINTAGRAVSTVLHPRWQESYQSQPPSQGVVYPPGGGQQYPPGGGQQYPSGGGQQYPPGGGQQYPPGGGQQYPPGGGQQYPPGGGQQYPPGGGQQYPPGGGQQYPPSGGQQYPPGGGQQYPPGGGQQYPPSGGQQYPPGGGQQYPPGGGQQYPPGGGQQYPPGGGQQYPPGGGQQYPPGGGQQYPPGGGQQYPPGHQSDQSVQPPGQWVYVPDAQKPPPPTRNSPTWVSDPTSIDSHPNMRKSYKDICKTLKDMDRLVDNILVKLE